MNRKVLWIAALSLLTGAAILLYYPARRCYTTAEQRRKIDEYERRLAEEGRRDGGEAGDGFDYIYPELYEEVQSYNETIYREHQSGLKDAWSYEQSAFELEHYGVEGEIYGVVSIPEMGVELPLYLGASEENMARGAAVLGQTSIPVGQENSNCVIAAHRGYKGIPMFLEIERLSAGDQVVIRTPWSRLYYTVTVIRVIRPDDIEAVHIQEGRDMVTLITCHPYPGNTKRYLVYCERATDETGDSGRTDAENDIDKTEQEVAGEDGSDKLQEDIDKTEQKVAGEDGSDKLQEDIDKTEQKAGGEDGSDKLQEDIDKTEQEVAGEDGSDKSQEDIDKTEQKVAGEDGSDKSQEDIDKTEQKVAGEDGSDKSQEDIDKTEQKVAGEGREEKRGHLQMQLEKWIPMASVPLVILAVILLVLSVRKKVDE